MRSSELLRLYKADSLTLLLIEEIKKANARIHAKGLHGGLNAVIAACATQLLHDCHLFVAQDREEAAYFQDDLQSLLPDQEVLFFPASHKKPYHFESIENANVLMRTEVLNAIQSSESGLVIVTFPEAISEKVINKKSLISNTFLIKKGDSLGLSFLYEFLIEYGFENTDFVYEVGQFAVRGGIIDVFSYAQELPTRIELFGDEVESIREFDPGNQTSVKELSKVHVVPNVQTRLLQEERQSLFDFIQNRCVLWFKDMELSINIIKDNFEKVKDNFQQILRSTGGTQVVLSPNELFETKDSFLKAIEPHAQIEFGNRFYYKNSKSVQFDSSPQPPFNKNFELFVKTLAKNQEKDWKNIILSNSENQLGHIAQICEEIDPFVKFDALNITLKEGFVDKNLGVACYTDHQLFDRYHKYTSKNKFSKTKALTLKELRSLSVGDYVTHVDHGVGRFAGLEKLEVNSKKQEALRLVFKDNDLLYISIHSLHKISKYAGKESTPPTVSKLGGQEWKNKKKKAKRQVKDIARNLIELYAKRKVTGGFAFSKDSFLQAELETSFIYQDTPDQSKSTQDVKSDMEQAHPMDRLVCGDVGFGKTEIAMRAAFKATLDNKQVAILVPTTILAMQHYQNFSQRLANFPVRIEYINRFKTNKATKEILHDTCSGKVNILIGTHRIVNKDVVFKDLGLMIVDEEQKFGVKVKEKLKEFKVNVDTLTLTATPIPRTLHFSLMGARDLSIIATPPPNRQPITTELHTFNNEIIRDAISFELKRGGQVFFVHNRISSIEWMGDMILKLVPDAKIGIAHGQLDGLKLEKVMLSFISGEFDILLSTNIIESGLDIPNANTIIINSAQTFGLSDLHQMRGRVGRANRKAFCYLLSPPIQTMTNEARKRLSTLEEFTDLGDGFKVAIRDMDIRGAGNLLGSEQSGFISDLGFEMYHNILDEAVQELKETEFRSLFEKELKERVKPLIQDCVIETDMELLIPEEYVSHISERLSLYNELDNIKTETGLSAFSNKLKDRFGQVPDSVFDLMNTVRIRWEAVKLGIEKLFLKNGKMTCYFVGDKNHKYYQSETFGKVLAFIQSNPQNCKMRNQSGKLILTIQPVNDIKSAFCWANKMIN